MDSDCLLGRATDTAASNSKYDQTSLFRHIAARLHAGLQPICCLLMLCGIVLVIWLAGGRMVLRMMTLGAFIVYLDLCTRFVGPLPSPRIPAPIAVGSLRFRMVRVLDSAPVKCC